MCGEESGRCEMGMLTILFGYIVVLMRCWFECECDEKELVEQEERLLVVAEVRELEVIFGGS